jgi:hypothetical protein
MLVLTGGSAAMLASGSKRGGVARIIVEGGA